MRINHNISAMNAQRQLSINQGGNSKALQKLSSGLKINTAADDAAGLAISERMRAQIRGLNQAQNNAQDGISLIQTAEGALQETTELVQRMRELAVQATSDIMTSTDREAIETEMNQLRAEIDRSANTLAYNGKKLFTGEMADPGETTKTVNYLDTANTTTTVADATIALGTGASGEVPAEGTYTLSYNTDKKLILTGPDGKEYISDTTVADDTVEASTIGTSGVVTFEGLGGMELNLAGLGTGVAASTLANQNINIKATSVTSKIELPAYEVNYSDISKDFEGIKIEVGDNASIVGTMNISYDIAEDGKSHVLVISDGTNSYYGVKADGTSAKLGTTGIQNAANVTKAEQDASEAATLKDLGKITFKELDITIDFSNMTDATAKVADIKGDEFSVSKNPSGSRVHVGANAEDEGIYISIADMTTGEKGLNLTDESISVATATNARNTLSKLDEVLTKINTERANLGAMQNRIESTVNNLALSSENLTSAESRIRDVDMAAQMVEYSKYNILNQAAMSMLAQANSQPNMVMNLLQGL